MKIVGDAYRDDTRLEHMLQALLRIQATTAGMTRDSLFLEDVRTRALMSASSSDLQFVKLQWKGYSKNSYARGGVT